MSFEVILDALSTRWTKGLLSITLSALGGVGIYAYTQITSWAEEVRAITSAHDRKDQEQDLRLERLTLLVETTNRSVDKLADSIDKQGDKRDERLRRLLDALERKSYNVLKKESE